MTVGSANESCSLNFKWRPTTETANLPSFSQSGQFFQLQMAARYGCHHFRGTQLQNATWPPRCTLERLFYYAVLRCLWSYLNTLQCISILDQNIHPCHSTGEEQAYIKSGETVGK